MIKAASYQYPFERNTTNRCGKIYPREQSDVRRSRILEARWFSTLLLILMLVTEASSSSTGSSFPTSSMHRIGATVLRCLPSLSSSSSSIALSRCSLSPSFATSPRKIVAAAAAAVASDKSPSPIASLSLLHPPYFHSHPFVFRTERTASSTNHRHLSMNVLLTRGGAVRNDNYDDEEKDEEEKEEDDSDGDEDLMFGLEGDGGDDLLFDDVDGNGMNEADFAEDNTIDRMVDAWKKTPPFTKGYLSASVMATVYGYVCNKNQFPSILLLDWKRIITNGQLWRLVTSFLNFGPLGLGYIMTAHFVWTYMSTLERLNHNRPYDFWIMIAFGQLSMIVGYPLLRLSPNFLGHNLSTFLVYIWSRYHEGIQVSMFDLFTARAEMLPWFFLAQTFLLEGELPVLDFLGIVFGHIYYHCKSVGMLRAPKHVIHWYKTSESPWAVRIRNLYKPISSDFEMAL